MVQQGQKFIGGSSHCPYLVMGLWGYAGVCVRACVRACVRVCVRASIQRVGLCEWLHDCTVEWMGVQTGGQHVLTHHIG